MTGLKNNSLRENNARKKGNSIMKMITKPQLPQEIKSKPTKKKIRKLGITC